ncbi:helix-turn-helix domain-containing protein, partial [Streptomyces tricolor]
WRGSGGNGVGRKEKPLDADAGPVQRFAADLRALRGEAGAPTYRAMAQRSGYSAPALSQAAAGEKLPTLAVALAYVAACGGDADVWEKRWRGVAEELAAVPREDADAEESPYRGLTRFEPGDGEASPASWRSMKSACAWPTPDVLLTGRYSSASWCAAKRRGVVSWTGRCAEVSVAAFLFLLYVDLEVTSY